MSTYFGNDSGNWGIDRHGGFVGFYFSDGFVGLHCVADFFEPGDVALRNRVGKRGTLHDTPQKLGGDRQVSQNLKISISSMKSLEGGNN